MTDRLVFGQSPIEVRREPCVDCNGEGEELMPCDADEEDCEFCGGLGYHEYECNFVTGERMKASTG